jgi:hypothetical protein
MAAKKKPVMQESFLNAMARKLGHAAGTLTKVTHELADSASTLPENIATKVHEVANAATSKQPQIRTKSTAGKRVRGAVQARRKKSSHSRPKQGLKKKMRRNTRTRTSKR